MNFNCEKILILGGGSFLGYWIAKALELNDYEMTFFNTGKNTPKLFPNFETKVGDRRDEKNKTFFSRSSFDVIIDTSAYSPLDLVQTKYLEFSQYIYLQWRFIAETFRCILMKMPKKL